MQKENEYAKNTIILLIGKFATQCMSLILVPLYTYYLTTSDYGTVDLIQTYITLFVPIVTLKFDSAAFRFLIDARNSENEKKKIISNIILVLIIALVVVAFLFWPISIAANVKYRIAVFVNILVLMVSNILLQFLRGVGKNKEYTIAAIISAVTTLIVSVVLIIGLSYNASSLLIASSVANIISLIYITCSLKLRKYIDFGLIDKKCIGELLQYSIPMIPNQLSWWIVNVSDRSLIAIFGGTAFNGIYTVSCKFSNLVNTVFGIFNMSWQETASLHVKDEDRDIFFSEMINKLFLLFASLSLLLISVLPLAFNILVGPDYSESYNYIPILLTAGIFNVLISLLGGVYVAFKKVRQVANTTILSAIINFTVNLLFISRYGLYAASYSTLIAYATLAISRLFDIQRYVAIKLNFKKLLPTVAILAISIFAYYYQNIYLNVIIFCVSALYSLIYNWDTIKEFLNPFLKKIKK